MIIPSDLTEREGFYSDLVMKCLASRGDRKAEYERLRSYYLYGAGPDSDPAIYNKIEPALDLLTSFLFAVDTTRFAIQLGAATNPLELNRVGPLVKRLNEKWQDSGADVLMLVAITWALVYSSMFIKLVQRGSETHPFIVDPHNFGVLREDVTMLDRQEAFVHVFYTTYSELQRNLVGHPKRADILKSVSGRPRNESELPAGVRRIITSSFYPTMSGNVNAPLEPGDMYRPRSDEPLIELQELWLWDDNAESKKYNKEMSKQGDYRVVTMTDPGVCIYDRPMSRNMGIPGEHPFIQICPMPTYDYFWGHSQVQKLTPLQDLREHHLRQINSMVDLMVTSPKALVGQWGAVEEKDAALRRLGALIAAQDPTSKVEEFKPQMPNDLWAIMREIDMMFDDAISLHNLSRGMGDTGVRSKGQTESLLRVGSARPKKRAYIIEDSIESMATKYVRLDQLHNPIALTEDNTGKKFIAKQFTDDFMAKVDAHSSSPIFVEDQRGLAMELHEAGIIDGEAVLDILQPQNVEQLKKSYRAMAAARAQQAKEEMGIEKMKVVKGSIPRG